jgi:hypothetical protein
MQLYLQPLMDEAIHIGVLHSKMEESVRNFIGNIPFGEDGGVIFSLVASCLNRCTDENRLFSVTNP